MWASDEHVADAVTRALADTLPSVLGQMVAGYTRNPWHDYFIYLGARPLPRMRYISTTLPTGGGFYVRVGGASDHERWVIRELWEQVCVQVMGGHTHMSVMAWNELLVFLCGADSLDLERIVVANGHAAEVPAIIGQIRAQIREQVAGYCVRRDCAYVARIRRKHRPPTI